MNDINNMINFGTTKLDEVKHHHRYANLKFIYISYLNMNEDYNEDLDKLIFESVHLIANEVNKKLGFECVQVDDMVAYMGNISTDQMKRILAADVIYANIPFYAYAKLEQQLRKNPSPILHRACLHKENDGTLKIMWKHYYATE